MSRETALILCCGEFGDVDLEEVLGDGEGGGEPYCRCARIFGNHNFSSFVASDY